MTISHGARRLQQWLKDNGHNQEWMASHLTETRGGDRVYQSSVSSWLRGAQIPLWAALAVERLAGIPAAEWVDPPADSTTNLAGDPDDVDGTQHARSAG